MKFTVITNMKQNFAVKFIQLVFVLWCNGVVTYAQNDETLGKNASATIVRPRPTTVAGNMNVSKTVPSSQMTLVKIQTRVSHHHSFVKAGTRTIIKSSMTDIPQHDSQSSAISDGGLIIVCVAATLVLLVVAGVMASAYKCRKRRNKRSAVCRVEMHNLSRDDYPLNTVADVEKPTHSVIINAESVAGQTTIGDNTSDETEENTSSHTPGAYINPGADRSSGIRQSCNDLSSDNNDEPNRTCENADRFVPFRLKSLDQSTSAGADKEYISLRTARSLRKPRSLSVPASVKETVDCTPNLKSNTLGSKTVSKHSGVIKKIMTTKGGVIKIDDVILKIGARCLAKDTEITLIQDDQNDAFKSLLHLGLLDATLRVVELLPDGLKFVKPADLTIRFQRTLSNSELFILHGSYNHEYQSTVWDLVGNDIKDNRAEGFVNIKINGFCFYSLIAAKRGKLARILSHLNHSFTCCAYAFYRRLPSLDTIDISVVMLSEFVDERKLEDIKQLKDHFDERYVKAEKGMLKRVHTKRHLEISLDFLGVESTPFSFKVDQAELDKDGFVIDHFNGIAVNSPASGKVKISEVHRSAENKLLWPLNIREEEQEIKKEETYVQSTEPEPEPKVVYRSTQLTNREISRMSRIIGLDWDSLAGLMDIPYSDREEIRVNQAKYPSFSSKAEQMFALINWCQCFGRHNLEKCVEELGRHDLKNEMLPVKNENATEGVETSPLQPEVHAANENVELRNTPLSSREMYRLSQRIVLDWDSLAGLMDIGKGQRDNIRYNTIYNDDRARAEKILSMINNKKGFSRKKLVDCLKGIKKLDLISPVITGEWRKL